MTLSKHFDKLGRCSESGVAGWLDYFVMAFHSPEITAIAKPLDPERS